MESNPGGHDQPYIILYINLVIYYTHHILLVEKGFGYGLLFPYRSLHLGYKRIREERSKLLRLPVGSNTRAKRSIEVMKTFSS